MPQVAMVAALYFSAWAAIGVLLYVAHRRGHLVAVGLALLALSAAAFGLAFAAMQTQWRDADGWADCWPSCEPIHELTRLGLFFTPGIVLLVGLALAFGAVARRHSKGTAAGAR